MPSKSEWPAKTPICPDWCDYNTWTYLQKITFIGATRAILALISLGLCVAFLAVYDTSLGVGITLGLIMVVNIIQILMAIYFIYNTRSGKPELQKSWFVPDLIITGIFIVLIIVLLCIIPTNNTHIFLGCKLIVLSLLFSSLYLRAPYLLM